MTVGLSITKCGSFVISVAAPAPKTRNRLNHCMVSIGFLRRNCQPIWASPSAMAVATDTARFLVARYRMRKSSVDAKSSSNSFAASRKYFMGDPIRFARCRRRYSRRLRLDATAKEIAADARPLSRVTGTGTTTTISTVAATSTINAAERNDAERVVYLAVARRRIQETQ